MTLTWTTFFQFLAWAAGILALATPLVPPEYKPYVVAVTGAISITLHQFAGKHNEDGTSQNMAFSKEEPIIKVEMIKEEEKEK